MRRVVSITLALAASLGLASACSSTIDSVLENEPCIEDDECGSKQACVRTTAEALADLPGQCLPENDACEAQLGCPCDPEGLDCFSTLADYPEMICDPDQLVCVVDSEEDDEEDDEEETEG